MMVATGPDLTTQIQAVAASLIDAPVAVEVRDLSKQHGGLMAAEAEHVTRAIQSRQTEFAAGRDAARAALAQLGLPVVAIPAGPDRAPIWPKGVAGSISHNSSVCVAVVSNTAKSLGIDIERDIALPDDLVTSICSEKELGQSADVKVGQLAKLIFSAKEAAFKAQYPISRAMIGFDHLDVALNVDAQTFSAAFLRPTGPFETGNVLSGRYARVGGHLLTAVTINQDETKYGGRNETA